MSQSFGMRLQRAVADHGPVVAGIDPHPGLLEAWGLPQTAAGAHEFGSRTLEAVDGAVAAVKPQAAFFERFGSAGVSALESLLASARAAGMLTILDVKRGDIGSTMEAYAAAHLLPGSPGEADAVTLSPYLGIGSLRGALDLALAHGKGGFVLALTSNPDGAAVQHAQRSDGRSVARYVAEQVGTMNAQVAGEAEGDVAAAGWGSIGMVVGATVGSAARDLGIDLASTRAPLLAPGFGAQGAGPEQIPEVFGDAAPRVLVSVSRALLGVGPEPSALRERVLALQAEYRPAAH